MPIQVQINNIDASPNGDVFVEGLLVASGNYTTGGDTVDFTQAVKGANFSGIADAIPSAQPPKQFSAGSQAGLLGYQYAPVVGSAQNNCLIKVGALNTFGTELAQGAYPAAVKGDAIAFQATFAKLR